MPGNKEWYKNKDTLHGSNGQLVEVALKGDRVSITQ
jgi:hypothetical protein